MDRILRIGLCLALVVVISLPALVLAKAGKDTNISNIPTKVYDGGVRVLDRTEGILNQCLKSTFSLFNPCLDVVKMCTDVVLKPLNYPFDYAEGKIYGANHKKRLVIPTP